VSQHYYSIFSKTIFSSCFNFRDQRGAADHAARAGQRNQATLQGQPGGRSFKISEAIEEAVRTIVMQALRSKELARQSGQSEGWATNLDCRGSLQLPSPCKSAPEGIPGLPTGMMLR